MAGKLNLGKVRGTTIYPGTEITGVDANGKTFPKSGITKAYEEDLYVNTDVNSESQGNVYICLTGGDADTAVWAYNGNLRGPQCEVINNLESSRTDAALTACQGRVLKDMMYDSGLITKEVEIDYSGNVQGIKVTTENRATTITVQTASGNITQEKATGAETTTVSAVPAKRILKVSSSDAYIRKIELYDVSNNLVYTDNISSWGAIEDIRQQMEESGTVVDGDDTLATGILAKVKNGVKKVFYPISHAKAIWYSIKENKTVYDVIAGLLTKTNELSETTTALTEKKNIAPTPISSLSLTNFKCGIRAGIASINGQIMCSGSSAVKMENGKDLLTGLPKPADGMIIFHAIPWNNEKNASNDLRTPLRLAISSDGKLCSFYPSSLEQISVGMPVSVNVSYFTND